MPGAPRTDLVTRQKFALPVDRAVVARDWQGRGFSCALFVDPPGQCWEGFSHAVNELVTVVEGRLEMEIAGQVTVVEPGDEAFIPAQAVHSVRNVHDGTSRWLYGYD